MDPPWLENLLNTEFFADCPTHTPGYPSPNSERNLFCIDCNRVEAVCMVCQRNQAQHPGHRSIRIRSHRGHCTVRVSEKPIDLDISDVQKFKASSYDVVYLKERPYKGRTDLVSHTCESCPRIIENSAARFCSLGCKFARNKGNAKGSASSKRPREADITSSTTAAAEKKSRRDDDPDDGSAAAGATIVT